MDPRPLITPADYNRVQRQSFDLFDGGDLLQDPG
jgi:hypothetical protein